MGRRRLLGAAAIISGVLSFVHAADSRGGGGADAALSAAVGLFDKVKAALECNVCKVTDPLSLGRFRSPLIVARSSGIAAGHSATYVTVHTVLYRDRHCFLDSQGGYRLDPGSSTGQSRAVVELVRYVGKVCRLYWVMNSSLPLLGCYFALSWSSVARRYVHVSLILHDVHHLRRLKQVSRQTK